MLTMDRYRPPHQENWQGRSDEIAQQRIHQAVKLIDLSITPIKLPKNAIAIVGFVCDEGIKRNHGRPGAAEGPAAIRQALAKLPLLRPDFCIVDVGDIVCLDNDLEDCQKALSEVVALILQHGASPLVLGGGHEQAWGAYQGIRKAQRHANLTIINIDAHYDLRPLIDGKYGSSGTSFQQIAKERQEEGLPFHYVCVGIQETGNAPALIETASQLDVLTVSAASIHAGGASAILAALADTIHSSSHIHLSICMDVFAAPYAPGVSAPQPLGLTPWQVIPLLQALAASEKVCSVEIAEVSPPLDQDGLTSRLAAALISYTFPNRGNVGIR